MAGGVSITHGHSSPLAWLRTKDPGLSAVRRAVRVALVACIGFYACRYGLHSPTMATYALFGAVALGALAQIPGSGADQARTLLAVLPAAAGLVVAGTLLSVTNWTAALGMFALGFVVSYVGVGGPRPVGLAAGMQLLYILPCFPPYDPGSLGYRLAGLALAVLLLAAADLLIWPDPRPETYQHRTARAAATLAQCLAALADAVDGQPSGGTRLLELFPDAFAGAESIRPSKVPPAQRPASAGRRDRALSQTGTALRRAFAGIADLVFDGAPPGVTGAAPDGTPGPLNSPLAAALLRRAVASAEVTARWLDGGPDAPDSAAMAAAITEFRDARAAAVPDPGTQPERLRLGARALSIAETMKVLAMAAVLARNATVHTHAGSPELGISGPFWYAHRRTPWLWWHRFREHLTPRSVYFQGALRLALALSAARLLAGVLDLSHGFWVLLAILTVLRTSAAETRSALRPALVGTVAGSLVAAGLLVLGIPAHWYAIALPVVMVLGFSAGALLGAGWAQALFTVVIALVFAQVAPVDWRLAEARVLDVAVGAAVGILIGLFAWPRGGSGELHRAAANFLASSGQTVREAVATLTAGARPGQALEQALLRGHLAEASFALYQTERHRPSAVDWQATLGAGHHVVRGGQSLLRGCPHGCLISCAAPLSVISDTVATGFERAAVHLLAHRAPPTPPPLAPQQWPANLGADLYHLVDIQVWLADLYDDLVRMSAPEPDRRTRLAALGRALAGAGQT